MAVWRDRRRIESDTGVADEAGQFRVVGFDEHVDAVDVGVTCGVDDRLA